MAWYRTGVPRRLAAVAGSAGTDGSAYYTPIDPLGNLEQSSLYTAAHKEINTKFAGQKYNAVTGAVVKRWGVQDGQQFEQASKDLEGSSERAAKIIYYSTAGTSGTEGSDGDGTKPLEDWECCAWLHITAPSFMESGSTAGISAGAKKGCVYYWAIEDCNPTTWGCGSLSGAGDTPSGDGLHYTNKGMLYYAPLIPETPENCGKTVDVKIKVAVLTADGKKQLAAEYGSAGWSGYGMGPGDDLYETFGPEEECSDTANITVTAHECEDEPYECTSASISYTTLVLTFYEGANFTVENPIGFYGNVEYKWTLSGDGGLVGDGAVSTSLAYGRTAQYKAPGLKAYCVDYGATLTLYCDGYPVDSVYITIKGVFADPVPRAGTYYWLTERPDTGPTSPICDPAVSTGVTGPYYWSYANINITEYDCNGKLGPFEILEWGVHACWCSQTSVCVARYNAIGAYPQWVLNPTPPPGCCP